VFFAVTAMSHQEESQSTPALIHVPEGYDPDVPSTSLGIIPENNLLESYTRLSISLEENGLFKVTVYWLDSVKVKKSKGILFTELSSSVVPFASFSSRSFCLEILLCPYFGSQVLPRRNLYTYLIKIST
jgi:hypothetical protein